jgi:hypothetical protein
MGRVVRDRPITPNVIPQPSHRASIATFIWMIARLDETFIIP